MDVELLQLALKSLSSELQEVKNENKALRIEINEIKRTIAHSAPIDSTIKPSKEQDELIPLASARKILNVGRNTFLSLVREGIIKPIRMNLRTIRYSRIEIQRYIENSRSLVG
ncbi:MAG: helix-turn-helix domain-containing protein [Bacteroidetes bacterium]|nr:helix-turn-helix domain-containing protein [Bacteroidota bacterium]